MKYSIAFQKKKTDIHFRIRFWLPSRLRPCSPPEWSSHGHSMIVQSRPINRSKVKKIRNKNRDRRCSPLVHAACSPLWIEIDLSSRFGRSCCCGCHTRWEPSQLAPGHCITPPSHFWLGLFITQENLNYLIIIYVE